MSKSKEEKYLDTQTRIHARGIFRFLQGQRRSLADFVEALGAKGYTVKESFSLSEQLSLWNDSVQAQIPEYLVRILPAVMRAGARPEIAKYKEQLPKGYALVFNISTAPAVEYLNRLTELHLSQREGSISRTTNQRVLELVKAGVDEGMSYGQIAKQIRETDPFVFSKARATLIATQEIGNAYGWANYEPAMEMQRQGYVLEKKWATKHDGKVRPSHSENESEGWIPLSQPFSGTWDMYAPSSRQFRCRCTSSTRIV